MEYHWNSCAAIVLQFRSECMSYLFTDEGARQSNNGPEENATAQDDLSVEAVAQVTEDGSCHHETADEDCERKKEKRKRYFGYCDRKCY